MTSTSISALTSRQEQPVYLLSGDEHVFGVLTLPLAASYDTAVLFLHAGEQNLSCHRNRLWTRLARELAGHGYACLRLDFHGSGDSSGILANRDVFGQAQTDVRTAVDWLRDVVAAPRVVIIGTCWGALVAIAAAASSEGVVRAGLVSPPLRLLLTGGEVDQRGQLPHERLVPAIRSAASFRVLHLLATRPDYRGWVLSRLRGRLSRVLLRRKDVARARPKPVASAGDRVFADLARRGVPVHVLFGERDRTYLGLQAHGGLPSGGPAAAVVDVSVTPAPVHGLETVLAQEVVRQHVLRWMMNDSVATTRTDHEV
jgi:pimeloyl-ACP methyl ester carboxylesterase